ncbi:P-loop containing nucleoside triphosphate hydrolase protein [Apiospora kogelbergensis]|uniref:P-loop containing nucleoside triphosphate hydrolase protein n=1 Tax=Apiospora kogelbergensis TaxID=1337665 RepID=UPI00312CCD3A
MEQPEPTGVRYTTNCFAVADSSDSSSRDTCILSLSKDDGALGSGLPGLDAKSEPVLEVVTDVNVVKSGLANEARALRESQDIRVTDTRSTSLVVRSELLSQTIKDVVKFYPGQSFTGDSLTMKEPYAALMHHLSEFEDLKRELWNQPLELGTLEEIKLKHLQVLLGFITDRYQKFCLPAEERMLQTESTIRFEDVWFLMKPGSLAYTKWDKIWIGCSIEHVHKLEPLEEDTREPEAWVVDICFLQMSWSSGELESVSQKIFIDYFNGARSITSLPVFPRQFHDRRDSGLRRQEAEQWGRQVSQMLWDGPKYLSYEGERMDESKQHYKGQVVIDGSHDVVFHNSTESLLEPDKFKVLNAMVHSHLASRSVLPAHSSDYRGNGLTIFLYGPPGCGKNTTIESICSQVQRPLVQLNEGTIGRDSYDTPNDIKKLLTVSERWGAIYSAQSGNRYDSGTSKYLDLLRPSFTGILFLVAKDREALEPTGRGSVQLIMQFTELDDTRRKAIWDGLQQNLKHQSGSKFRLSNRASNLLNHSDIHELKWNGHVILQCFKSAVALAESDSRQHPESGKDGVIIVDADHFKDAINTTEPELHVPSSRHPGYPGYPGPPGKREAKGMKAKSKTKLSPLVSDSDIELCIPQLNRTEWEGFKAAASDELFRKTKFYAIDVLLKEPVIKLQAGQKGNRKEKGKSELPTTPRGQAPLPERIRINSTTILKVFQEIKNEGTPEMRGSTLLFRPFRSLVYYESEFKRWASRQEVKLQGHVGLPTEAETSQGPRHGDADGGIGEQSSNIDFDKEKAALDNVGCLLTFIDDYIKPKQEFLKTALYDSVTFADIWEDSVAEFEDNPVFIHCVYVDFDGSWMGPVNRVFCISRFPNSKPVSELPVYPVRFATEAGLEERLVERGKLFVEAAKVKHMHYSGLTLQTHDDVDSQVMVDFEEAINRNPGWEPQMKSVFSVDMEEMMEDANVDRVFTRTTRDKDDSDDSESEDEDRIGWCVKECCENESVHDDEYIEAHLRDEYIGTRMRSATSTGASVAIVPRSFSSPNSEETFDKDDLMIMTHRVPGFVLRNRKWAWLELKHMTEVAIIGEDEGFDQLVLPDGHKNMVKSMIQQHFQNRKSIMKEESKKTDIVRGKGKGVIILLHGVPGVGKTSTAECVADSFHRPLFQITSGDLGTTAKEVEEALETNFALAHRWNCILLIDEADVFLAERTRDDFKRNSLVAVFLRIMEYYAGVLILTTNRVGVFDEAFTSRIHISLYYPPLKRDATREIFQKNIERTRSRYELNARKIDIREYDITKFAGDYFDDNKDARWNGRQIRNAFHSAIALAELEANDGEADPSRAVVLGATHFETVATAYKAFTDYLHQTLGVDPARRARENVWRSDNFGQALAAKAANPLTTRLTVPDPRSPPPQPQPPPGGPWQPTNYANYAGGSDPRFAYPPGYPGYPYTSPDASYPAAAPAQPREPMSSQNPYAAQMARYPEHYASVPHTDVRQPLFPGPPSTGGTGGQGNVMP